MLTLYGINICYCFYILWSHISKLVLTTEKMITDTFKAISATTKVILTTEEVITTTFKAISASTNVTNENKDTEAAVSVLPKSCASGTAVTSSLPLVAANNTTITTYGTCKRIVAFSLKRDYTQTFIVADIKQPILRADFLIHYSLLVNLKGRCLRDMRTSLAIQATLSSIKSGL